MSKGNMLLGHARGKVGSLVFSRSNGQQIVRARAEVVKNPRTRAQLIQRIIINTVAQAYSLMQPILDHSFEGVPKGQRSMSYFNSQNAKELRERVAAAANLYNVQTFSPLGTNVFALNPYKISKGSLPKVAVTYKYNETDNSGVGVVALSANTYAAVLADYGLQRGDQLTFVVVRENGEGSAIFEYARVILDPRDADGNEAPLSTAFTTNNAPTLPSSKNEGSFTKLAVSGGNLEFAIGDSIGIVGVSVIVSRKGSDGNWLRSNAQLVVASIDESNLGATMGEALDRAIQGSVDVESPYYLNNAGKTAAVAEDNTSTGGGSSSGGGSGIPGGSAGGEG